MQDEAILEIRQVNGLSLSADKTWQGDSGSSLRIYRALVTSGMLADIPGNALKVLLAMALRAGVLGGDAEGEPLFRHLMGLELVTEADRGKLFCYATQEDMIADCGFDSPSVLTRAICWLTDRQIVEKRGEDDGRCTPGLYLIDLSRSSIRQPQTRR